MSQRGLQYVLSRHYFVHYTHGKGLFIKRGTVQRENVEFIDYRSFNLLAFSFAFHMRFLPCLIKLQYTTFAFLNTD